MASTEVTWDELNKRHLLNALADVRRALQRHAGTELDQLADATCQPLAPESRSFSQPPAFDKVTQAFGLSVFERAILLLCTGMELESSLAALCAGAQNEPRPYPTFSLALAALPEPHWSAITPAGPLRRWRLIEVQRQSNVSLTNSPLRIDERILHFLAGVQHLDERLEGLVEPAVAEELVPSHQNIAHQIAATLIDVESPQNAGAPPLIQLCGSDEATKQSIATAGCREIGLSLFALRADSVPAAAAEFEGFLRLWTREAVLTAGALYVATDALDRSERRAVSQVSRLLERLGVPVVLSTRDRWRPIRRIVRTFDVQKPTADEQIGIWRELLGDADGHLNGCVNELASHFNLSPSGIRASVREALGPTTDAEGLPTRLWIAGRAQARPRLEDLAQRIEPLATWDDLILPAAEKSLLQEMSSHVANRTTVYDRWGFAGVSSRGLGISALFSGASGTGKTMAAEVLANGLRLDLYRIDLSSVVNKYIGETEKNLRRVFDAAEDGGAILFFDEADALFGKRSEVKDSHDRYANIEINYLLQRMESYRGLSVLATNMKGSLDPAFLRRIRFVINFSFPDAARRAAIWERIFPPPTPVDGLDMERLAKLNVAGGNIRNIALSAAFLAASAGEPVRMAHIWRAAGVEYAKLDRPLNDAEAGGWR